MTDIFSDTTDELDTELEALSVAADNVADDPVKTSEPVEQVQVDTGIPLPLPRRSSSVEVASIRALANAEINSSILIVTDKGDRKARQRINHAAHRVLGKGCYAMRTVPGGVRVWKIGEADQA